MTVSVSHITHIDNLASIITHDCLWSDSKRLELGLFNQNIGYSHIKERRLRRSVSVATGGVIGQYVPFNFCPRSVMLYVIHKGHDDFRGGQERVLHLITDIHADLDYADEVNALLQDVSHKPAVEVQPRWYY